MCLPPHFASCFVKQYFPFWLLHSVCVAQPLVGGPSLSVALFIYLGNGPKVHKNNPADKPDNLSWTR